MSQEQWDQESRHSRQSGYAEQGLVPNDHYYLSRAGPGQGSGGAKVKFSDWKKTNDKKSEVRDLPKAWTKKSGTQSGMPELKQDAFKSMSMDIVDNTNENSA